MFVIGLQHRRMLTRSSQHLTCRTLFSNEACRRHGKDKISRANHPDIPARTITIERSRSSLDAKAHRHSSSSIVSTPVIAPSSLPPAHGSNLTHRRSITTSSARSQSHQPHHNIDSFLSYARRTRLSPSRTVYKGTHYEYSVAAALKRLGFQLVRTGGASDRGVDLVGLWRLPRSQREDHTHSHEGDAVATAQPERRPIRVIVQCKAVRGGLRPRDVRELESTVENAAGFAFTGMELDGVNGMAEEMAEEDGPAEGVLGLLVSTAAATRGVREALVQSSWPVGFLKVTEGVAEAGASSKVSFERGATVQQFIWNRVASETWLRGVGVAVRHSWRGGGDSVDGGDQNKNNKSNDDDDNSNIPSLRKEVGLTWMGEVLANAV